jgi:hypothetical protein
MNSNPQSALCLLRAAMRVAIAGLIVGPMIAIGLGVGLGSRNWNKHHFW